MLDGKAVLAKTDAGREAIARRTHNLNPRQRALLISINGETDVAGLLSRFGAGALETAAPMLQSLLDHGLVEALNQPAQGRGQPSSGREAAAAASGDTDPAGAAGVVADGPDRQDGSGTADPSVAGPSSLPRVEPISASPMSTERWREMQQRASDGLHELMGEDADLLAMRLLRSRSEAEFASHLERAISLIRDARGDDAARSFQRAVSA